MAGIAVFRHFGYPGLFLVSFGTHLLSFLIGASVREPKLDIPSQPKSHRWIDTFTVVESLLPAIGIAFLAVCHGSIVAFLPLYALELGLNNPGLYFAVAAGCVLLSRVFTGPLSDRVSRHAVVFPGYLAVLVGMVILGLASSPSLLLVAAAINGFGFGAVTPAMLTLAVDQAPTQRRALAIAQFQVFYDIGVSLGAIALGVLLDQTGQNYSAMYLVAAGIGLCGLVIYSTFGQREKR